MGCSLFDFECKAHFYVWLEVYGFYRSQDFTIKYGFYGL